MSGGSCVSWPVKCQVWMGCYKVSTKGTNSNGQSCFLLVVPSLDTWQRVPLHMGPAPHIAPHFQPLSPKKTMKWNMPIGVLLNESDPLLGPMADISRAQHCRWRTSGAQLPARGLLLGPGSSCLRSQRALQGSSLDLTGTQPGCALFPPAA